MKTKKFKIWVAVDGNGDVYVYTKNKPHYDRELKSWFNGTAFLVNFSRIGKDEELKVGEDTIKEIEFELPLKGEKIKATGMDVFVAVDKDASVWIFSVEPKFDGTIWRSRGASKFLGFTHDPVDFAHSLCKVHLDVPYDITYEL